MARLSYEDAEELIYSGKLRKRFVKEHLEEFNAIVDPDGVPFVIRLCASAAIDKAQFLIGCGVDIYKYDDNLSNILHHMMRFWDRVDMAGIIQIMKTTPLLHASNIYGETPALEFIMRCSTVDASNKAKYIMIHDAIFEKTNLHHIQNIYQNKFLCCLARTNNLLRHHLKHIKYDKKYFLNDFGWGKLSEWVRNSGNAVTKKIIKSAMEKSGDL